MWNISRLVQEIRNYRYVLIGFVLLSFIIALVAPSTRGFQYQFSVGRPWQYDLLMAPYDFPIYKTEAELSMERDSIRHALKPVYQIDRSLGEMMLGELQDEYQSHLRNEVPLRYYNYLHARLAGFYTRGLMQVDELSTLRQDGKLEIQIREGDVLQRRPITYFYSLREAYDIILDSLPANLDRDLLERMNVGRFLKENVIYDEALTGDLLTDALGHLASSKRIVQQGERIIDRGELVSSDIYNVLESLSIENERRSGGSFYSYVTRLGVFLTIGLLMLLVGLYLVLFTPGLVLELKNILLIQGSILIFVLITALNAHYDLFNVYIIPFVMLPILWRIFYDSYVSLVSFIALVLASAIFVAEPLNFIFIQMVAGLAALVSMQQLSSRAQMIKAAFVVYLAYSLASLGVNLIGSGELSRDYWVIQLYFGLNLVLLTFTYILSFLVERALGYVSYVSLMELSDIHVPLLRELSERAPGTFQHSLQVSILASDAAAKIGGNIPLTRAGGLYHDIGKLKNPAYFTENQGGNNPHMLLQPEESARIIIRHVTDGIILAQKHSLPSTLIDFIRTHHGLGMTKYFYITACNEHPDVEIDPETFTYPGPNPWTKEQGLVMLADAVEASSRSLESYTEEAIRQHVERIVDSIVDEGLLTNTPITFKDIQTIKAVFVSKLQTLYHTRISYPEKR